MEVIGAWWLPWSSKPVAREQRAVGSIPIHFRQWRINVGDEAGSPHTRIVARRKRHVEREGRGRARCTTLGRNTRRGFAGARDVARSEGRRVGKECVSACRYGWSQHHYK